MMHRALLPLLSILLMAAAELPGTVLSSIDLAEPFETPPGWRFIATQGPEIQDPLGMGDDKAPGAIRLCLSRNAGRTCQPTLDGLLAGKDRNDIFAQPHFLEDARIVHPRPDLPILLVRVASLHSGDGDQRVATVALSYDRSRGQFVPAYEKQTGRNNSQEIRYVDAGPLRGAVISAEPTSDAPFAFWITVARPGTKDRYVQVLRYRSATRYGDGNPLAVIDSEMPGIQQRLGYWRSGPPPPLPAGPCRKPRLIRQELWC